MKRHEEKDHTEACYTEGKCPGILWTVENLQREMDYPSSVERIVASLNANLAAEILYNTVKASNPTDKDVLAALRNYQLTRDISND